MTMSARRRFFVLAIALIGPLAHGAAHASFEKEYERFNREQSRKELDNLDNELRLRIEEEDKEAKGLTKEEAEAAHEVAPGVMETKRAGWRVRPSFTYKYHRESNFFQRTNDPDPEVIHTLMPSVLFTASFMEGWRYTTRYDLKYLDYFRYPHNSHFDHAYSHSLTRKWNRLSVAIADELDFFAFQPEDANQKLSNVKSNHFSASMT